MSGSPADLLRHGLIDAAMLDAMGDARLKSFGGRRKGSDTYTEIFRNQRGTLRVLIRATGAARLALHARMGYSVELAIRAAGMAEERGQARSALEFSEWATLQ